MILICYLICKGDTNYIITPLSCFSHSHECKSHLEANVMEGKVYISFEADLTKSELNYIEILCVARNTVTQISTALEKTSPGRAFEHVMLNRIKKKVMTTKYGKDMHDLPGLHDKCREIWLNGGIFEIIPSPADFGIEAIHCQSKLMGQYTTTYGDLRMGDGDGNFKLSQYGFDTTPLSRSGDGQFPTRVCLRSTPALASR